MDNSTNNRYRYLKLRSNTQYRRFKLNDENQNKKTNIVYDNNLQTHGSYGALLFKPEWKAKREEILNRDNYSCVICKINNNLQVHHRQYHFVIQKNQFKLPWQYPENLLVTLCESCHKKGHRKFKVPTIYI